MKTTILSLLGCIALIFIGCSNEPQKETVITTQKYWGFPGRRPLTLTPISDVEVFAVAVLPDGREIVVKKFDTPPSQQIEGIAYVRISGKQHQLPMKGFAHVTFLTGNAIAVLKLPYNMQRKGDLIDPRCGNSYSLAKK
jgi:hypothetical protein